MIKIFEILNSSHKLSIFFLIIYFIIGMIVETFSLGLVFGLLSLIINENYVNLISQYSLLNFFEDLNKKEVIYYAFALYFLVFVLRTIILIFVNYKRTKFISEIRKFFSDKLFSVYLTKPIDEHINTNSSIFVRNLNDVNKFADLMFELTGTIGEIIIFLGITLLLIFFNPSVFLITTLFGFFGAIFYLKYSKKTNSWGYQRQSNESDKQKIIQESFRSIKLIKLLVKENWFLKKFSKANSVAAQSNFNLLFLLSIHRPIFELAALLVMILIIVLLTLSEGYENDLVPALGLYAASFYRLIPSLTKIVSGFYNYKYNSPVVDVIHKQIFTTKNRVKTVKFFPKKIDIKNSIEIRNVEFYYPREKIKIFNNANLSFQKGQIIGIIGESGTGKTTLISLIMGFYRPSKGFILVDGKNIFENEDRPLLNIGYVPQETYLYDETIKQNIAFATDPSEIDEKKIFEVIRNSNLEEFIETLPLGINSKVGELGDKFSGGQKQRIGIARSLYNNPDVLILDESTSSLDQKNELAILSEIKKYKENKIVIIISHKKTTTAMCDRVFEIANKEIKLIK